MMFQCKLCSLNATDDLARQANHIKRLYHLSTEKHAPKQVRSKAVFYGKVEDCSHTTKRKAKKPD